MWQQPWSTVWWYFAKTKRLNPGESETVTFTLNPRSLSSFNADTCSWIAETGEYRVYAGASSRDIRQSAVFSLDRDIMVKEVSRVRSPSVEINTIRQ